MTPRSRALGVDFGLGAGAVGLGALAGGTPQSLDGFLIGGIGLFAFVATLYVAEQTKVLVLIERTRPTSLVVACVTLAAVGVALVVGQVVVETPAATLLVGMGTGLIGYRLWFGLVAPVPPKRLDQASVWGSRRNRK
ncbi:hypothetical protein GRX03_15780 [Halovenus sp. WSH3]|uniref:Uncharacterized protein n=1 Tax=Halovenus carboxidivorans TaxID=2692199 RepID=A0A6B0T7Y8_9EURY|nr:hypothetical protein [Halovenus carboxidivorans]MXR53057.1 hypothetical protein [Halovenus carboxidivorans]